MRLMINADALRVVMAQRGLTAEDIGRTVAVSARHVRGLAAGSRQYTSEGVAGHLATALGVPVDTIVTSVPDKGTRR